MRRSSSSGKIQLELLSSRISCPVPGSCGKGGAKYGLTTVRSWWDFLDILSVLGGQYYDEKGTLVFDEKGSPLFQMTYDNANVTKITPQNLNQMVDHHQHWWER